MTVAFMTFNGYNYEDAVILNENLVKDDKFTSLHLEDYEMQCRQTKLGDEEITRDIPNVSEESRRNLDADGIVTIGTEVKEGDILVGKVTPKGIAELSSEVNSAIPFGVTLPTKISPSFTSVPITTIPLSSKFLRASSLTLGISLVISSGPNFVSRH